MLSFGLNNSGQLGCGGSGKKVSPVSVEGRWCPHSTLQGGSSADWGCVVRRVFAGGNQTFASIHIPATDQPVVSYTCTVEFPFMYSSLEYILMVIKAINVHVQAQHIVCQSYIVYAVCYMYLTIHPLLPIPFNTQQEVAPPPYDHWAVPPNQRPLYLGYELLKQMLDVALITRNFEPTVRVLDMFFSSPSCINGSFLNRYCTLLYCLLYMYLYLCASHVQCMYIE